MSIKFEIKGVNVVADTVDEAKGLILELTDKRHFNVPVAAITKNQKKIGVAQTKRINHSFY